ncbi:hypothetical protein LIER_11509 [Lithospermum erythrorhizon]|uniref:Secreted protein n=1 Tax=Lithospermum erythrorhizon TaxID=34254 RepID=A0AAV3PSL9_LITER
MVGFSPCLSLSRGLAGLSPVAAPHGKRNTRFLYEGPFLLLFGKTRFSGLDRLASNRDPLRTEEGHISGAGKSYEHSTKSESYLLESDFSRSRCMRFVHQLLIRWCVPLIILRV